MSHLGGYRVLRFGRASLVGDRDSLDFGLCEWLEEIVKCAVRFGRHG